jgi:hypothetical protein
MSRVCLLALAAVFVLGGRGYAASADDHLRDLLKAMTDLAEAIEKKDDAKERQLEARVRDLEKALADLNLPAADRKKLTDKYKDDIARASGRLFVANFNRELSPDSLVKDAISTMNRLADAMDKKDLEATKAAIKRMKEIDKKMKDMKISVDDMKKLQEKYKKETEEALGKLLTASLKVAGDKEFADALKELK